MISIGLDISMRSSGITILQQTDGKISLVSCGVVAVKKDEYDEERLFNYNAEKVIEIIEPFVTRNAKFVIESLSLRSVAGILDRIIGNHWTIRSAIVYKFNCNILPVAPDKWRKEVLTREDLDERLAMRRSKVNKEKIKREVKQMCLNKIDKGIVSVYNNYIDTNKLPTATIYDLSDSYHIANYGFI